MKLAYDKEADALYIYLKEAKIIETEEVADGIICDFDAQDEIVGIEVLSVKRRTLEEIKSISQLPEKDKEDLRRMFAVGYAIAA